MICRFPEIRHGPRPEWGCAARAAAFITACREVEPCGSLRMHPWTYTTSLTAVLHYGDGTRGRAAIQKLAYLVKGLYPEFDVPGYKPH